MFSMCVFIITFVRTNYGRMKGKGLLLICLLLGRITWGQTGAGVVVDMSEAASLASGGQRIRYERPAERWIKVGSLKPFGLKNLRVNELEASWRWLTVDWEAGFVQQGDAGFREQGGHLGVSRDLGPTVSFAVRCVLYQRRIAGFEPSRLIPYPDLTLLYKPSKGLTLGFRFINPTGSRLATENNTTRLYQSLNLGVAYTFNPTLSGWLEGNKEPKLAASLHTGLRYHLGKALALRGGVAAPLGLQAGHTPHPLQPGLGMEACLKRLHLAVGWQLHARLGATSCVTITYLIR